MARLIVDEIVRQNTETEESHMLYYQTKQSFPGTVTDDFKKVKLDNAAFGFQTIGIYDRLLRNLEKMKPDEEDCYVVVQGQHFPVKKQEFCILKALAVEQVSKCKEYAGVVSYMFMQLLMQVLKHEELYLIEPSADWTVFQKKAFDIVLTFILEQVGQKKAAEVQEVI